MERNSFVDAAITCATLDFQTSRRLLDWLTCELPKQWLRHHKEDKETVQGKAAQRQGAERESKLQGDLLGILTGLEGFHCDAGKLLELGRASARLLERGVDRSEEGQVYKKKLGRLRARKRNWRGMAFFLMSDSEIANHKRHWPRNLLAADRLLRIEKGEGEPELPGREGGGGGEVGEEEFVFSLVREGEPRGKFVLNCAVLSQRFPVLRPPSGFVGTCRGVQVALLLARVSEGGPHEPSPRSLPQFPVSAHPRFQQLWLVSPMICFSTVKPP